MMKTYSFTGFFQDLLVWSFCFLLLITIFSYFYEGTWRKRKAADPGFSSIFDYVYQNIDNPTLFERFTDFWFRFVRCAGVMPGLIGKMAGSLAFIPQILATLIQIFGVTFLFVTPLYMLVQKYYFGVQIPNAWEVWIFPAIFVIFVLIAANGRKKPFVTSVDNTGKVTKYFRHRFW